MLPLRKTSIATVMGLVLWLAAGNSAAESGLLTSALGRWLDTDVLPQLGKVLGEHPRFKGEKIKLVSLHGGRPSDRSSRLHQAVEAYLTQHLLRTSGVRIAWSDQPRPACGVIEEAVYLLGVEIERDGGRNHKLNIGMIDITESEWVSGVNHTWRGRLTATETAALGQPVASLPRGSVDNPLPVHASSEIAAAMHSHLRCAHPEGLDGSVFLQPADSADLNRIMASLRSELSTAPIASLTGDPENAAWVLSMSASLAGTDHRTRLLGLQLIQQSNQLSQQVATVYVDGPGQVTHPPDPETRLADIGGLLSDMRLEAASDDGICTDHRKSGSNSNASRCAEVSFDLLQPAYLFVLSSSQRKLQAVSCEARLIETGSGERRFRFLVPRTDGELPDAGIYAIAVSNRATAGRVSRHIRKGVCSRPLSRSETWLAELDALISNHQNDIDWRAIHLTHALAGVEQL